MEQTTSFVFHDPGLLEDGELRLVLVKTKAGEPDSDYVPTYFFRMTQAGQDEKIGSIQLRVGNTPDLVLYGGHIGYGVEPAYRGHHYAARACRLLFPLALRHGLRTLWITCNPDNIGSRKTCERLGAELVEIVDLPEDSDMYQKGWRQKCRYRIDL
jgi:tagatose 1,6-diphosphate aldolase